MKLIGRRYEGSAWRATLAGLSVAALLGCSDGRTGTDPNDPTRGLDGGQISCSIPSSEIFDGGPGKDGIPALTDPRMVAVGEAGTEYLRDEDRVIGIVLDSRPIAIPHNIGWWHEIVNLNHGDHQIAITYCPLTGSSLVFDRKPIDGAELGVSGLLYQNNLIMYDRTTRESLWPQMSRGARCGPRTGAQLPTLPAYEMTWKGWRELFPATLVVARTSDVGLYRRYPYGNYESLSNPATLFPVRIDGRRPAKERVLGVPFGSGAGVAFPFGALDEGGSSRAVNVEVGNKAVVIFWDHDRQAAVAHEAHAGGRQLKFTRLRGEFVDEETGSGWTLDGRAIAGPLAGRRLEPLPEAYVAFWFAWALFQPDTQLWGASRPPEGSEG